MLAAASETDIALRANIRLNLRMGWNTIDPLAGEPGPRAGRPRDDACNAVDIDGKLRDIPLQDLNHNEK
jgi:hypothetical protein